MPIARVLYYLFLFHLMLHQSASLAGMMHQTTPEQDYLDHAKLFPSVVGFSSTLNGIDSLRGSAVVIDSHWVITAAHNLYQGEVSTTPFFDGFGIDISETNVITDSVYHRADQWFVHPGYYNGGSGADIALVYFDEPIVEVAPTDMFFGTHTIGDIYHLVGYGRTMGGSTSDGQKRAGTMILRDINKYPYIGYIRTRFDSPSHDDYLELGILGMEGDSGGGWFTEVNGEMLLAGITSFGIVGAHYGYGDWTAASYFPPVTQQWIAATMQSIPEPSSLMLASLAGVLICSYRRRA